MIAARSARRRIGARMAVALVALLAAGCLSRSPSTEFYSLRSLQTPRPPSEAGIAIGVGPVRLPRYLDRPQMVRRTGQNEVAYDEFHRWAGGLNAEVLRVLGANLSAELGTKRVAVYPAEPTFTLAYRVVVDVDNFEAGPDGAVTLRSRWVVLSRDSAEALLVSRTDLVQPVSTDDPAEWAAAHSAAVATLSREIAAGLRSVGAAAP